MSASPRRRIPIRPRAAPLATAMVPLSVVYNRDYILLSEGYVVKKCRDGVLLLMAWKVGKER